MKSPVVRAPTPQGVLHDTMSIFQLQPCSHYSAFCPILATLFCLDCIYLSSYLSLFLVSMLYKCGKLQLFTSLLQHHGGSWALIRPTLDGNRTSRPRRKENPHASLSEPMSLLPQRLPQELRLLEGLSGAPAPPAPGKKEVSQVLRRAVRPIPPPPHCRTVPPSGVVTACPRAPVTAAAKAPLRRTAGRGLLCLALLAALAGVDAHEHTEHGAPSPESMLFHCQAPFPGPRARRARADRAACWRR